MYTTKSTLIFALVAFTAKLVVAVPPACLLAAVNTQPNPADLQTICRDRNSQVRAQLQALCNSESDLDAALAEFRSTCEAAGYVPSVSSSVSSTTSESATTSSTSSGSATTSEASSDSVSVTSDTSFSKPVNTPVLATSTYYDTSCSCTKTAVVGGTATGPAVYPSNTGIATGGPSGPGNVTVPTGPSSGISSPSATQSTFTGAATRSMAGSIIGVVVVAAGFAIAL